MKATGFVLLALALCGCAKQSHNDSAEMSVLGEISCQVDADTIADGVIGDVQWIALQQSEEHPLRDITKMCQVDSLILLGSKLDSKVDVYTRSGRFLYEISHRGSGANEYLELAAFTATNTSVYLLDNYRHKMQRYAIADGSFMEETDIPFVAWDFEAFSDENFLFTCLRNNPDATIQPKPIDYALWRTDGKWNILDKYLPVAEDYYELTGKQRYFSHTGSQIRFHTFSAGGYYEVAETGEISFRPIAFQNPIPEGEKQTLASVNEHGWQYLSETPFCAGDYAVMEVSASGEGRQMLASLSEGKAYANSETWARNLLLNIVGTIDDSFVGYISDIDQYHMLIAYGFIPGDEIVESTLSNEGACLIVYRMKK